MPDRSAGSGLVGSHSKECVLVAAPAFSKAEPSSAQKMALGIGNLSNLIKVIILGQINTNRCEHMLRPDSLAISSTEAAIAYYVGSRHCHVL